MTAKLLAKRLKSSTKTTCFGLFVITDSDDSTYEYSGVQIVKSNDTAISSLKVQTATEGSYYNISGVRVAAPAKKGIYIHNGRKFVVK